MKDILMLLCCVGEIVAAGKHYHQQRIAISAVRRAILKHHDHSEKITNNEIAYYNAFYYLRNKGFLNLGYSNGQLFISLTEEGKKRASRYQIDQMKIMHPEEWDRKWRILIFDIANKHKMKREALRGKLKQLGFYMLQQSVWVYPFNFKKEIDLLRSFFGLSQSELIIVEAISIEEDLRIKKYFHLHND